MAEDNPYNRFLLQKILQKLGVGHTDFANDGQQALAMAKAAHNTATAYHVVFMDLRMPGLDGLEATKRLREAGLSTPIVALTAQATEEDAKRCRQAGATAYFSKPYRINDLEAVLADIAATAPNGPSHDAKSQTQRPGLPPWRTPA